MTNPLKIKLKKKKQNKEALVYTAINGVIRGTKKVKGVVHSQALSSRPYFKR